MRTRDAIFAYAPPRRLLAQADEWMNTAREMLDDHRASPGDAEALVERLGIEATSRGVQRPATFILACYAIMTELPDHPRLGTMDGLLYRMEVDQFPRPMADAFIDGLERMRASTDPTHDLAHLTRVLEVARLLWTESGGDNNWPLLATAIAWHDAARYKDMGPLLKLSGSPRGLLGRIPLLHNLSIAHITMTDARRSIEIANERLPKFGLLGREMAEIARIITGSDSRFLVAGPPRKPDSAACILSDADALDVISFGRWEILVQNSLRQDPVVARHFDQVAWLSFHFAVPKLQGILSSPLARQLYTFWSSASLQHLRSFYPDDSPHYHAALLASDSRP